MARISISIPDELKEKAEKVAASYALSIDAYIQSLIRRDLEREIDPELERELIRGFESPAEEMTKSDWGAMRRDLKLRFGRRPMES